MVTVILSPRNGIVNAGTPGLHYSGLMPTCCATFL